MGKIAKILAERPQGSLPRNTEINPREQVKSITLRSAKEVERNLPLEKTQEEPKAVEIEEEAPKEKEVAPPPYKPKIPYPSWLKTDHVIPCSSPSFPYFSSLVVKRVEGFSRHSLS